MGEPERRRTLKQARIPPELVDTIVEGRCVLFAGAGFSLPVTGLSWNGLMSRLRADLPEIPANSWEHMDPLDQAQMYVDQRGRPALEALLKHAIPDEAAMATSLAQKPGAALRLRQEVASLPFPYIFTTNYDALIELLLSRARIPHTVLVDDDQVLVDYPARLRRVVKVHGDLELSDTIILSRDDYFNYRRLRPGMYRLWQSLLVSHTFLFFGFGLTDPNFRILFHDLASLMPHGPHAPRAYAFMAGEAAHRVEHWRRRGLHIIESRDFTAQDRKIHTLAERVQRQLRRRDSLPHLLEELRTHSLRPPPHHEGPQPPAEEGLLDPGFLTQALAPAEAHLRKVVAELWADLKVPTPLLLGESSAPRWHGAPLVDVPARKPREEERAELLFNTIRLLRRLSPELGQLDGDGPLGPPVSALLGALLYRSQRWVEAIEALEEARYWYEERVRGVPWWIARMLGRAARRAGDRPSAWEFLRFCVQVATRHSPSSLAACSDAALLTDVAMLRVRRLRRRLRLDMARSVIATALEATRAMVPTLAEPAPREDLYLRRTRGYGSWHQGELMLEAGSLEAKQHDAVLEEALPHLIRGVRLLPGPEARARQADLEVTLAEPYWVAYAPRIRLAITEAREAPWPFDRP